jgi:ABC-type glycerol-3-phosphate transport system substrate-binding protein
MKRVLSTILTVVLIVGITGIAAAGGQSGASKTGQTTINLMGDNRVAFDKMLELYPEFEARTGIKLNFVQLQETPLRSKTGLELAAPSTDIDVVMMDFRCVSKYSAAGYLEPLDSHLAKFPTFKKSDFMKPFIDAASINGTLYGVPISQECAVVMYRADIFKELNLNVPKTFEELEDVCKKIKAAKPDIYPISMRGARGSGMNEWIWPCFLWGFGGRYYDPVTYKATLNTPEAIKALEYYVRLLQEYGPPGAANNTCFEAQTDLMQGNSAIFVDANSLIGNCEDPVNSKVAGKLGYAVIPGNPGKAQSGFYSWVLVMPKNSKNKAAAAEFIAWLTSPDIAVKVGWTAPNQAMRALATIPAYKDYSQSRSLADVMSDALAIANADDRPRIDEGEEIGTLVSEAISSTLSRQTTARQALEACNTQVDKILKDAGYQK